MQPTIGFIGIGVMGSSMVKNLLKANYSVVVYNRTRQKADEVVSLGANWADSPAAVTAQSDIILSMVGYPQDVEAIYYGDNGIFSAVTPDKVVVDMTTSTPTLAQKIAATASELGLQALDAPVSGGDIGAQNGTLTVMVGGDQAAYEQVKPVFEAVGQTVQRFGEAGKGQHTKMANQIMIAGTMTGMTEMLVYAQAAGLDLPAVLKTVNGGSAQNWSLANYGPRILAGDYTPGFFAKHFLKDLKIALEESEKMGLNLPATHQAKKLYARLVNEADLGDDGTQALIKLWTDSIK